MGFINLYETAGDRQFFVDNNFLDDQIHFSWAGGEYMGQFLFDAFITDGLSLVPEPATAVTVAMVAVLLTGRRRR